MKILYIACGSGCDQTMGGSFSRTIEIARRLSNKGHSISLLTTTGGKAAIGNLFPQSKITEFKTLTCAIYKEQYFFIKQFISYVLILLKSIPMMLSLPKYDLIYLDSDGLWDIIPALIYKLKNRQTKIVSMNHHKVSLRREGKKSLIFSFINIVMQRVSYLFLRYGADALFVLDTHMGDVIKEEFTRMGYKKKMYAVKDGLDVKQVALVKAKKAVYDACFFGYLRPSKGLYDIVPIWKNVVKQKKTAILAIIGGMLPEYRSHLLEAIERNNLIDNIIIHDYIPEKEKAIGLVKQSKIFISPSHEEGWGISIMECLGSGIPGVVWELPTYDRIFHEGLIKVKQYDISKFSKSILLLLKDSKRYKVLQKETQHSIKKYDWDVVAAEEEKLFKQVIKN